jgi:hypothetical protein
MPLSNDADYVSDCRSVGRCNDADSLRESRDLPFPFGSEETFRFQFPLRLLKLAPPKPFVNLSDNLDGVNLELAALFRDPYAAQDPNFFAFLRHFLKVSEPFPPHHASDLALFVFEGKVGVTALVNLPSGNFASNPNPLQKLIPMKHLADILVDFGDGENWLFLPLLLYAPNQFLPTSVKFFVPNSHSGQHLLWTFWRLQPKPVSDRISPDTMRTHKRHN